MPTMIRMNILISFNTFNVRYVYSVFPIHFKDVCRKKRHINIRKRQTNCTLFDYFCFCFIHKSCVLYFFFDSLPQSICFPGTLNTMFISIAEQWKCILLGFQFHFFFYSISIIKRSNLLSKKKNKSWKCDGSRQQ